MERISGEVDDDSDNEIAGKNSANTRRVEVKLILTPRQKTLSSADKLGNKIV